MLWVQFLAPLSGPLTSVLLDSAGFRFDADAQAKPPRWEDMARATTFARERWAALSNSAALSKFKVRFDNGLSAMEAAVRYRNVVQARAAAKAELAMVFGKWSVFGGGRLCHQSRGR